MTRLRHAVVKVLAVAMVAAGLGGYLARNYVVIGPGPAERLATMVTVEGGVRGGAGAFLLTAVTSNPANLLSTVTALLSPAEDIVARAREIPPGVDMERYLEIMEEMMLESQAVAAAVALRKLGYEVRIETAVRVEEILRGSPAGGLLNAGDVLTAVDGHPVTTADEATRSIAARRPGSPVVLTVKRNGHVKDFTVVTIPHASEKTRAAVGILIGPTTSYELPLEVRVDSRNIKGSSAGLMFALEILDQVDPRDLTGGRVIAGTGSIGPDGAVGPVAGVKQKVIAAERAGAEVFLVPLENELTARSAARRIEVVGVSDIDDALAVLADSSRREKRRAGE